MISEIFSKMGAGQSVRATAFQRPKPATTRTESLLNEDLDDHLISISNKMVERLVEDAALAGGAAAASTSQNKLPTPRGDYRDKIFMEKLKCLDDSHSEITGITVNDLSAIAARIDMRTSNMVSVEPICSDCKDQVIQCYNDCTDSATEFVKCWDTVGAFKKCVQDAGTHRLRARTQREARERARRSRHVLHAREHALKDLTSN